MLGTRLLTRALCAAAALIGLGAGLEAQLLHDPRFDNGTGERWAVVIGISEYEDPGITDLSYAHRDAEAFAQFLRTPLAGLGGFKDDHIRLLTNQDASANQIRTALFDFLARPAPDDIVYFFFAGHGMPQQGRPNGTQYLVPSDGDHTNLAGSAVRMADVESAVFNTQAQVVLFIDACHAGAVATPGGTRGDDLNRINSEFIERIAAARPSGVSMVVAAHEGEYAHEGTEWGGGHGVFTYHLIQALGGRGDRDEDGIVDLGEVYDYVRARVPQDTDNQQTPFANSQFLRRELPMAIVADSATLAAAEAERVRVGGAESDSSSLDVFVATDLTQQEWFAPDSIVAFVGVPDTLEVLLGSPTGRRAPPTRLRWTSSNTSVATVDGFGTVHPESPGVAEITASVFTKDARILVRVLPTPTSIVFSPPEGAVDVSQFDELRFAATVELPSGETVAGVLPTITIADTSVVASNGNGRFTARREGRARVEATLGARSVTWDITVRPPRLSIDRGPYGAMRFTDTIPLLASFVRDDGSRITDASGVTWQSSDTTVLRATASGLVAVDVGRAVIRASVSSSRDSVEIFVLGDIIVTSEADGGHRISTVDLGTKRTEHIADGDFGDRAPQLSPDGRRVAFVSTRNSERPRIHVMDADGGRIQRLTEERGGVFGLPGGSTRNTTPCGAPTASGSSSWRTTRATTTCTRWRPTAPIS